MRKVYKVAADENAEVSSSSVGTWASAAYKLGILKKAKKKPSEILLENLEFAQECLQAHNEKRALHKAPPLRLNKKICQFSQEWARHLASQDEMFRRSVSDYGENLFLITSSKGQIQLSGSVPVEHWYKEISEYVYGRDKAQPGTGHFTQVVWVASKELGVGKAMSRSGQIFVVCNYRPPGNIIGTFADNVPPLGGFSHRRRSQIEEVKDDDELKKEKVKTHEDQVPPIPVDTELRTEKETKVEKKTSSEILLEHAEFAQECLQAHNEKRALHKAPPLRLNKELCKYSENWARHLASQDKMILRPKSDYGQNIFMISPSEEHSLLSGHVPVEHWYNEKSKYVYGKNTTESGRSFTQIVWMASKELGVGKATSRTGQIFVVCNYDPPGNKIGTYIENVPPLGGFTPRPPSHTKDVDEKRKVAQETPDDHSSSLHADTKFRIGRKRKVEKKTSSEILLEHAEFARECLQAHNEKRALHKAPPLQLNKKLCKYSEEWARHLASKEKMFHRSESDYGENLYMLWSSNGSSKLSGAEPVEQWYNEISDYIYGLDRAPPGTGHFTQVVWMESKELGVGKATNKSGQTFVVCNYDPPGNFIDCFTENVPPVGGFTHPPKTRASQVKNDEEFQHEMVKLHNDYRSKHRSPPVLINKEMNDYAQEWAVHLAKKEKLEIRPDCPYGQNLLEIMSARLPGAKEACTHWYSKVEHFNYKAEPQDQKAGHFTQMVWRSTEEIGVGRAKSKQGKVYIVAFYNPRGNIRGKYLANVLRP